jgi:hypothetical protein
MGKAESRLDFRHSDNFTALRKFQKSIYCTITTPITLSFDVKEIPLWGKLKKKRKSVNTYLGVKQDKSLLPFFPWIRPVDLLSVK